MDDIHRGSGRRAAFGNAREHGALVNPDRRVAMHARDGLSRERLLLWGFRAGQGLRHHCLCRPTVARQAGLKARHVGQCPGGASAISRRRGAARGPLQHCPGAIQIGRGPARHVGLGHVFPCCGIQAANSEREFSGRARGNLYQALGTAAGRLRLAGRRGECRRQRLCAGLDALR
jgi:hypothetical protein